MKTKMFLFGFVVIAAVTNVNAQKNNTGVYLSKEDFAAKKISYEGSKIKTNLLFDPTEIKVVQNGTKTTLAKVNVYGYKTRDNKTYR